MPRIFRNKCIIFQSGFFIIISLALLMIPIRWIVGWFVAVFVHELFHYIALRLCKVSVVQITVGAFGVDIQTAEITTGQEILSALAGPLGSLMLLFLLHIFPYVSLCALVQLLFNLIPTYPMDGGRVVRGVCSLILGENRGRALSKAIATFFLILLGFGSLWFSFHYKLGMIPVLLAALIILRTRKIPCIERQLIVQ